MECFIKEISLYFHSSFIKCYRFVDVNEIQNAYLRVWYVIVMRRRQGGHEKEACHEKEVWDTPSCEINK